MSVVNEYDSGVPLLYVFQFLNASAEFVEEFGEAPLPGKPNKQALFEPVRVPREPPKSYIVVKAGEPDVQTWAGVTEYIGSVMAMVDVINVRTYPEGTGSEIFFTKTLQLLRRALCGNCGVEVFSKDGVVVGEVDEASYFTEVGLTSFSKGNFDILQKGIRFRIIWR